MTINKRSYLFIVLGVVVSILIATIIYRSIATRQKVEALYARKLKYRMDVPDDAIKKRIKMVSQCQVEVRERKIFDEVLLKDFVSLCREIVRNPANDQASSEMFTLLEAFEGAHDVLTEAQKKTVLEVMKDMARSENLSAKHAVLVLCDVFKTIECVGILETLKTYSEGEMKQQAEMYLREAESLKKGHNH
jgi:hypothetical protein